MSAPVDVLAVTTPTAFARAKRELRHERQELRAVLARIRALRQTGRISDREEAEGDATMFYACGWPRYRQMQAWVRNAHPIKNSHLSPRAALARVHPMTREQQAAETERRA